MNINKETAYGVVKKLGEREIAFAQSKDGKVIEFKIKCLARDLK